MAQPNPRLEGGSTAQSRTALARRIAVAIRAVAEWRDATESRQAAQRRVLAAPVDLAERAGIA
ncbi:MAG TPA: hypothetical protein VKB59_06730 [Micromonosporaceae bacterium]|nr:hypothetical protein [Micromonosporaceae bacterium]